MFVGKFIVHSSESLKFGLNIGLILSIKEYFKNPFSVSLNPGPLSGNLSGVNEIVKDGVLNSSQSSGAGKRALGLLTANVALSKDGSLSYKKNVATGEFLLKLSHKSCLDLMEGFEKFEWNVDDDGFTSSSTVYLFGGSNVEVTQRSLKLS